MAPVRAVLIRPVVAVGFVALFLLPVSTAHADCAVDERTLEERIADAPVVFVGTATEVTNRDRTATFDVHEIWKRAGDVAEIGTEVVIHGGPDEANAGTSVDRSWQPGQRYLVFPRFEDGRFVDDICTSTGPWTGEMTDARPSGARDVETDADADRIVTELPIPWIAAGVSVLVLALVAAYVASRRH